MVRHLRLRLAFHTDDLGQFPSILRGAPGLEKLDLHMLGPSGEPVEWFTEPTPRLTKFVIASLALAPARPIGLLRKLCLPELKRLVLNLDDNDYDDSVHEVARPAPFYHRTNHTRAACSIASRASKCMGLSAASNLSTRSTMNSRTWRRSASRRRAFRICSWTFRASLYVGQTGRRLASPT